MATEPQENNNEETHAQGPQVQDTANAPLAEVALQPHEAPEKDARGEFPDSPDTGNLFSDGLVKSEEEEEEA